MSLYLANRKFKVVRKLNIVKQFKESHSKGEIYMFIIIENIGNVPIIFCVRLNKMILKFAIHVSINYLLKQSLKLKILWGIIIYKYRGIKLFVIVS